MMRFSPKAFLERRREARPSVEPFAPVDVSDRVALQGELDAEIALLVPDSIDEGTLAEPYDHRIRQRVQQWITNFGAQLDTYRSAVTHNISACTVRIEAAREEHTGLQRRVADAEAARTAARPIDDRAMVSRPALGLVYVVFLVALVAADAGAFYQVLKLALPDSGEITVFGITCGMVAGAVASAHLFGMLLRYCVERLAHAAIYGLFALISLACWAGLGYLSFYIRMEVPPLGAPSFTSGGGFAPGAETAGPAAGLDEATAEAMLRAALLLALLHIATGLIASIAAYLHHNPTRERYFTARFAHERALLRAKADTERLGALRQELADLNRLLADSERIAAEERRRLRHVGAELHNHARHKIAEILKSPAMTDALFRSMPPEPTTRT